MHLVHSPRHDLPENHDDHSNAEDLQQRPGDVVFLTSSPIDLVAVSQAMRLELPSFHITAANPHWFNPHTTLHKWCHSVLDEARLVIVRLLGGYEAWPAGCDLLAEECQEHNVPILFLAGDDGTGTRELEAISSLRGEWAEHLAQCLKGGSVANIRVMIQSLQAWLKNLSIPVDLVLKEAPQYLSSLAKQKSASGHVLLLGYRAWKLAGDMAHIEALQAALELDGLSVDTLMLAGLRQPASRDAIKNLGQSRRPDAIISCLGFAGSDALCKELGIPWIQVFAAGRTREAWHDDPRGLTPSDLVMQIAMPEIDGRFAARCIGFRHTSQCDLLLDCPVRTIQPDQALLADVAKFTRRWIDLGKRPTSDKKIACVVANYPSSDGRLANGVGLDTPASIVIWAKSMRKQGYQIDGIPETGDDLINDLLRGPTNQNPTRGSSSATLSLADYLHHFHALSTACQEHVINRWGKPEKDRFFRKAAESFHLPIRLYGNLTVGIQPARGWDIDPDDAVHDPNLPPSHGYIAFYFWQRHNFAAHAMVHFGKHGSLEWLPGKALALSKTCWPQVLTNDMPIIYPFIVNDPGEGTQAKRRTGAVIIDHLTPPPQRAGTQDDYGELERLLDEYAEAHVTDPRRCPILSETIRKLASSKKLDLDCKFNETDDKDEQIRRLDAYMCMLKEHQIRRGLHIFGTPPPDEHRAEQIFLYGRIPSADNDSLLVALGHDFGLGFDILSENCPNVSSLVLSNHLANLIQPYLSSKRSKPTTGQLQEALSLYAIDLIAGGTSLPNHGFSASRQALGSIHALLEPRLAESYLAEEKAILAALDGQHVDSGPSGSPSRGRWDVMPTGRNFFGADPRALPTPAAMKLGRDSAKAMLELHRERHGSYPRCLAISAWGTSAMRTGGDDIAQALACIGAEPEYSRHNGRVRGFRILPADEMEHPRIDITLRVSGFFRDAFPQLMDFFSEAVSKIANCEEPADVNPIRDHISSDREDLMASGLDHDQADFRARARVFSSKPQTYGAGINSLIDSGQWENRNDIANLFIEWGGYAYGGMRQGVADHAMFKSKLKRTDAVIHNQDNREHDILDSDDYYQFAGGLTAAVSSLAESEPETYHVDHSNPNAPKPYLLEEEIMRIVRARATNPRWLDGIMAHGYKGASEIAATLDYLFAFAATTRSVPHHAFDLVFHSWIDNDKVRSFLMKHNPQAWQDILNRFEEALSRNLWHPQSNHISSLISEYLTTSNASSS